MMELSEEQINQISKSLQILEINSYIEEHLLEYEQFLEEEGKNKNNRST